MTEFGCTPTRANEVASVFIVFVPRGQKQPQSTDRQGTAVDTPQNPKLITTTGKAPVQARELALNLTCEKAGYSGPFAAPHSRTASSSRDRAASNGRPTMTIRPILGLAKRLVSGVAVAVATVRRAVCFPRLDPSSLSLSERPGFTPSLAGLVGSERESRINSWQFLTYTCGVRVEQQRTSTTERWSAWLGNGKQRSP